MSQEEEVFPAQKRQKLSDEEEEKTKTLNPAKEEENKNESGQDSDFELSDHDPSKDVKEKKKKKKEKEEESGLKWVSLEHRGVTFPPAYKPHGVPLVFKEKEFELSPEVEEVANFWAQAIGTEFGDKELVQKNFWGEFKEILPQEIKGEAESLQDFDFSKIKQHLEEQSQKRKDRPKEEKKMEQEKTAEANKWYKMCLFNKKLEKVSNFMVEPPGIFRGRGEHPHAGILKSRIVPEFVSINCGMDDPIPPCPVKGHAWKQIVCNQESTWLASIKDERLKNSGVKYIFLGAESSLKGDSDKKKYEKARRLAQNIQGIRRDYMMKMKGEDEVNAMLATCVYLIDKLALRVGNEKSEDEADTVGCCSLRVEHLTLEETEEDGKCMVTFDFLGKDSMRYFNTVEVIPEAYKCLKKFLANKEPKTEIFDKINTGKLNDYLKSNMEGLSAKVFRTYNASITLQNELADSAEAKLCTEGANLDWKVKYYNDCNRQVAILCNHQKAVSKNHDDQIQAMQDKLQKKKDDLEKFQKASKQFSKKDFEPPKGVPKNKEACLKKIQQVQEAIEKDELAIKNKDENKQVALGTSKINYMDPRITIAWCKKKEVPIEKVFPQTLRKKFAWAMSEEPSYQF